MILQKGLLEDNFTIKVLLFCLNIQFVKNII